MQPNSEVEDIKPMTYSHSKVHSLKSAIFSYNGLQTFTGNQQQ